MCIEMCMHLCIDMCFGICMEIIMVYRDIHTHGNEAAALGVGLDLGNVHLTCMLTWEWACV